jgi:hypothetical protein
MKQFIVSVVTLVFLTTCNNTERNLKLIQGSWEVVSLSKYPLTITGYDKGVLEMKSIIHFDENGILKIYKSAIMNKPDTLKYAVKENQLIIYYSDFGIPFQIEDLGNRQLELMASGYGESKEARNEVRRITLAKKED